MMFKLHYYTGHEFESCLIVENQSGIDIDREGIGSLRIIDGINQELLVANMVKRTCDYEIEGKHLLHYHDGFSFQMLLTESMNLTSGYRVGQKVQVDVIGDLKSSVHQIIIGPK